MAQFGDQHTSGPVGVERKVIDFREFMLIEVPLSSCEDDANGRAAEVRKILGRRENTYISLFYRGYAGPISGIAKDIDETFFSVRLPVLFDNDSQPLFYSNVLGIYDIEAKSSREHGQHNGGMAKLPVGLTL